MKIAVLILFGSILSGCVIYNQVDMSVNHMETARSMIGMHESYDRTALKEFMGVDPTRIEWCAAFVNSILYRSGIPGSESVHRFPLLARSFLHWGTRVDLNDVKRGDIVIFPRGSAGWQGHVGFYYDSYIEDGVEHWLILGGNQENSINISGYPKHRVIGVRRYEEI